MKENICFPHSIVWTSSTTKKWATKEKKLMVEGEGLAVSVCIPVFSQDCYKKEIK